MKAWQVVCAYFLVLNAAVQNVTSLEEELADSIFGEFKTSFTFPIAQIAFLFSYGGFKQMSTCLL